MSLRIVLIAPNLCYKVMQNSLNSFWVVMHGGCVAGYYWVYLTFLASIVTNWWGAHFPCCQILHVFISQKRSGCAQNHPTRSMNVSQLHFRTGALGTIRIILLSNSCHFIFISLSGAKLGQNWSMERAFSVPDICFWYLNDVTLADKDTNLIPDDNFIFILCWCW